MGFEIITPKSEFEKMKTYDEQTTARLFLCSDKRTIVEEGDLKARFLLSIHGKVTRAKAREIRGYKNGEGYLQPINAEDVPEDKPVEAPPAPKAQAHPNHAPTGEGPDFIINWGKAHKGKRLGDLTDKQVLAMTKGNNPAERKAMALAEIARREAPAAAPEAPAAPPAPLNYGPEDVVSLGMHQDVVVKDLPDEFLKSLADGVEEIHHGWTKAEITRRADEA